MTTVLVHGYNVDAVEARTTYSEWLRFVSGDIIEFFWDSYPASLPEAWLSGHWNSYHWAWTQAVEVAALSLFDRLRNVKGPVNVVCHSLGSRVVYEAMALVPEKFDRVLTLNGADSATHARACMEIAHCGQFAPKVLCVRTKSDRVLRYLGQLFTPVWGSEHVIGYSGLKEPWPSGWDEIDIGIAGDGPGIGDHNYCYRNPALWPIYRAYLR